MCCYQLQWVDIFFILPVRILFHPVFCFYDAREPLRIRRKLFLFYIPRGSVKYSQTILHLQHIITAYAYAFKFVNEIDKCPKLILFRMLYNTHLWLCLLKLGVLRCIRRPVRRNQFTHQLPLNDHKLNKLNANQKFLYRRIDNRLLHNQYNKCITIRRIWSELLLCYEVIEWALSIVSKQRDLRKWANKIITINKLFFLRIIDQHPNLLMIYAQYFYERL